jgi:hypothetical protein
MFITMLLIAACARPSCAKGLFDQQSMPVDCMNGQTLRLTKKFLPCARPTRTRPGNFKLAARM